MYCTSFIWASKSSGLVINTEVKSELTMLLIRIKMPDTRGHDMAIDPERTKLNNLKHPIQMVQAALLAAEAGTAYYDLYGSRDAFRLALFEALNLGEPGQNDTSQADGWTLLDRFAGGTGIIRGLFQTRPILKTSKAIVQLLINITDGNITTQQDQLGQDLAAIAIRQFEREGNICPGAAELLILAPQRYLSSSENVKSQVYRAEMESNAAKKGIPLNEIQTVSSAILEKAGFLETRDTSRMSPEKQKHRRVKQPIRSEITIDFKGDEITVSRNLKNVLLSTEKEKLGFLSYTLNHLDRIQLQMPHENQAHYLIGRTRR